MATVSVLALSPTTAFASCVGDRIMMDALPREAHSLDPKMDEDMRKRRVPR